MEPLTTSRDAELAFAARMEWAGETNVRATQYVSDGDDGGPDYFQKQT
jgi:hypothetical protein